MCNNCSLINRLHAVNLNILVSLGVGLISTTGIYSAKSTAFLMGVYSILSVASFKICLNCQVFGVRFSHHLVSAQLIKI